MIILSDYFLHRRNTGQTREKIDRIYKTLLEWSNCLSIIPTQKSTTERFSSLGLSLSEAEDMLHRLRRLVNKSDYDEQILLMQTAPVEWGWKKIENFFRCSEHQARTVVLQRTSYGDLSKHTDGRGNKPFDSTTSQLIQDFYLDDGISRQSSNAKDTRQAKGVGTVTIKYMMMSIGETYELFKTKYPNIKVSRSKFYSLKPSWVREDCPHQVCMCILHQNIDLMLRVSKYMRNYLKIAFFVIFFEAHTQKGSCLFFLSTYGKLKIMEI